MHVCICACVTLQVKKWELESSVSPRDVGFWCFPNQGSGTSSDEDVMSQSGFLSYSSRGLPSHAALLSFSFCLCRIFPSLCVCLFLPLVCFSPCLYLFFPLLLRCRGVGVCRLFFMNGMRCLLSESYFCADDEHKLWPHFLFCCLPFSDWLRFPSQWQRIWGSSECVLFL